MVTAPQTFAWLDGICGAGYNDASRVDASRVEENPRPTGCPLGTGDPMAAASMRRTSQRYRPNMVFRPAFGFCGGQLKPGPTLAGALVTSQMTPLLTPEGGFERFWSDRCRTRIPRSDNKMTRKGGA